MVSREKVKPNLIVFFSNSSIKSVVSDVVGKTILELGEINEGVIDLPPSRIERIKGLKNSFGVVKPAAGCCGNVVPCRWTPPLLVALRHT